MLKAGRGLGTRLRFRWAKISKQSTQAKQLLMRKLYILSLTEISGDGC